MMENDPLVTNLDYEESEENFNNNKKTKKYRKKVIHIICILIIICIINTIIYLIYHIEFKEDPIPELRNYASYKEINRIKSNKYPKKLLIFAVSSEIYLKTRVVDVVKTWQRTANILNPELGIHVILSIENEIPKLYNIPVLDNISSSNYNELYIKVFNSWKEVWNKYGYEYDYFMKADDDVFINIEKLGNVFNNSNYNPNKIEYFGFRDPDTPMCWGGPGYILSRGTLRIIYPNIEKCKNMFRTGEDIALWECINYSYKLIYDKQFEGCRDLHGMNGTEFLPLSENDERWQYWNKPNKTFTLSWTGNDKNWSFSNIITVHSTKPKNNENITMSKLNKLYGNFNPPHLKKDYLNPEIRHKF